MKHSMKLFAVATFALLLATPALIAQNMPITPEVSILPVTEPLDVGGTVLQPGTYLIQIIQAADGRNRVQVWNQDRSKVYATVLTVPHQLKPGEEIPSTTFVFYPANEKHPRALRTWFAANPPGDHGHDLVYPEGRAKLFAVETKSNVVSYPDTATVTETETPTLSVVTPEATVETYTYTPPPAPAPMVSSTETETKTDNMPSTASSIPAFALLGLMSIAAAVAIRFARA